MVENTNIQYHMNKLITQAQNLDRKEASLSLTTDNQQNNSKHMTILATKILSGKTFS